MRETQCLFCFFCAVILNWLSFYFGTFQNFITHVYSKAYVQFKVDIVLFMSQDLCICILAFNRCDIGLIKTLNTSKEHPHFVKILNWNHSMNQEKKCQHLVAPYDVHTLFGFGMNIFCLKKVFCGFSSITAKQKDFCLHNCFIYILVLNIYWNINSKSIAWIHRAMMVLA